MQNTIFFVIFMVIGTSIPAAIMYIMYVLNPLRGSSPPIIAHAAFKLETMVSTPAISRVKLARCLV